MFQARWSGAKGRRCASELGWWPRSAQAWGRSSRCSASLSSLSAHGSGDSANRAQPSPSSLPSRLLLAVSSSDFISAPYLNQRNVSPIHLNNFLPDGKAFSHHLLFFLFLFLTLIEGFCAILIMKLNKFKINNVLNNEWVSGSRLNNFLCLNIGFTIYKYFAEEISNFHIIIKHMFDESKFEN